jgi:putative peptidoglycan binding protein
MREERTCGSGHEPFCTVLLDVSESTGITKRQFTEGELVLLTGKIGSTGIIFIFLTTLVLGQGVPLTSAVSAFNKEGVTVFVIKNEIKKVQETLHGKGYYGGEVDGVIGLRTRASLRAYQKAENLPTTGQVDTRTAAGLGVRPESTWGDSKGDGWQVGHSSDIVVGDFKGGKPSAGIRWAEGSRHARKEVAKATVMEHARESGSNKQQAANEKHDR